MDLAEVAPGVELHHDVLERMDFAPLVAADPAIMPASWSAMAGRPIRIDEMLERRHS